MSKEFTIENEYLKLTVTTWGAQIKSVVRKCDGVEHMWQADPDVWGYHAPILFPHAGKVVDNKIEAKGAVYESGQHGFARLMEHEFVDQTQDTIVLELCTSPVMNTVSIPSAFSPSGVCRWLTLSVAPRKPQNASWISPRMWIRSPGTARITLTM